MAIEAGTSTYYQAKRGIVQDSLTFHVDAGIKNSYTGNALKNLSSVVSYVYSNQLNLSSNGQRTRGIKNSGYYDYTQPGWMYASASGISMDTSTIVFWMKCGRTLPVGGGAFSDRVIQFGNYFSNNSFGFGLQNNIFGIYVKGSTNPSWSHANSLTTGRSIYENNINNWIYYVIKFISDTTFQVYMNNTLVSSSSISDGFTGIAGNGIWFGQNMRATLGCLMMYSKVLSDDEITQNFNATRHRFGL